MATGEGTNLKLQEVNVTKGTNSIAKSFRAIAFVDGATNTYNTAT